MPLNTIYRGILPFWLAMFAAAALIAFVPGIATFLPNAMYG